MYIDLGVLAGKFIKIHKSHLTNQSIKPAITTNYKSLNFSLNLDN